MRRNIIQSKTEPNKNDIWLSEEGLKKYGKNGWEPLGGGSNSGGYSDIMVLNTRDNAILTEEQFNEIEERVKNGCLFELQFHEVDGTTTYYSQGTKYKIDSNNCWYIFNGNFGVTTKDVSYTEDVVFLVVKSPQGYGFMGMRVSNLPGDLELPILRTPKFYYTGNGTKFLSDDGTYKEVGGSDAIEYFHLNGVPKSGHSIVDISGESWYEVKLSDFNVQDLYEFLNPVAGVIPSHKYLTITIKDFNLKNHPKLSFPVCLMEKEDKQIYANTECKIIMNSDLDTNGTINSYKGTDVCACYISVFIDSDKTTNNVRFNYRKLN